MFVRARPTIDKNLILNILKSESVEMVETNQNFLFFNSGTAALKWFLQNISSGSLKVGVQAFTCSTVVDAIAEANHQIVFFDTDERYFTTLISDLEGHENINVLILTHLFGIPNPDHVKIRQWAKQNNIIVIDDLAQTVGAKVNGKAIELLADFYFYSFAFDKPLSAGSGALLKIDDVDIFGLKKKYEKLKKQTERAGKRELKKLIFYYELTSDEYYQKEFRTNSFLEKLLFFIYSANTRNFSTLQYFLSSKLNYFLSKIELRIKRRLKRKIEVRKLSNSLISYIQHILKACNTSNTDTVIYAKRELMDIDHNILFLSDENIYIAYGQRFSVLTSNPKFLIEKLRFVGIESGNYNWPNIATFDTSSYPKSLNIVNKIVNVPIWSDQIWKKN